MSKIQGWFMVLLFVVPFLLFFFWLIDSAAPVAASIPTPVLIAAALWLWVRPSGSGVASPLLGHPFDKTRKPLTK